MNELIRIGVDLAKNVFQVHGVDRRERPAWCKRLPRGRWLGAGPTTAPVSAGIRPRARQTRCLGLSTPGCRISSATR